MFKLISSKLSKNWVKTVLSLVVMAGLFFAGAALAAGSGSANNLGGIADNITKSFESIGHLMIAISYVAGIGFGIGAVFKFKQHKDNPTQIPVGTPLALLAVSICLVFLPALFGPAGNTLFGTGASTSSAGGFEGKGGNLPGESTGGGSS